MRLGLTTLVVRDYDEAIQFFVDAVGFELVSDEADEAQGEGRRWVVVAPPGRSSGLLLARADTPEQLAVIGNQTGGRVGFFLYSSDFHGQYARMRAAKVEFLDAPRSEPYGMVCVWRDLYGNRWDLLEDRA
ncbi:MAG: VOC family protein [Actinomycetota bacterium]|nr:VOC family protein [Actinomycetota bacterium]